MKNTNKKVITTVLGLSVLIGGGLSPLNTFAIYNPDAPVSSELGNQKQTRSISAPTSAPVDAGEPTPYSNDANSTGDEGIMLIDAVPTTEDLTPQAKVTTPEDLTPQAKSNTTEDLTPQAKSNTTETIVESEDVTAEKGFNTWYLLAIGAVVLALFAFVTLKKKK